MYNGTGDESGLGVDTSDDKTIVFNLKEPCAYFEQLFVLPVYMPTHRELQTETNGDWAMGNDMDALVSCGPYYLAEYVPNQYSVYKKMKLHSGRPDQNRYDQKNGYGRYTVHHQCV